MRTLYLAAALVAFEPTVVLAQSYGKAAYSGVPCNTEMDGQTLIVSRVPTTAELAASIADRGADAPALLLERDHLVCDGSVWKLVAMIPQYR